MTRRSITAALIILAAAAGAAAQARPAVPAVAGQWALEVPDSPHGPMTMGLTLTQDGAALTGTLVIPHASGDIALTGKIEDHTITLSTAGDAEHAMTLGATVNQDGTLTGYLSSEFGDTKWSGKRVTGNR